MFREKLFLFKIFWIKFFEKKSVLIPFLDNASNFESKLSSASDLKPFFYNSTNSEPKILERVRFPKKSFTTDQVYKWNWFVKKQILKKVLLSGNHSWFISPRENAKFCSYAFSQKPTIVEKNGKKVFLPRLLKSVRFWINFCTTSQILNQKKHLLLVKFWIDFPCSVGIWNRNNNLFAILWFLRKHGIEKRNWKKRKVFESRLLHKIRFWKNFFYSASDFEWRLWKRVKFWAKYFHFDELESKSYNMSGFGMKALQQTDIEVKLFPEIKVWWTVCVQKFAFSIILRLKKRQIWQFCAFLKNLILRKKESGKQIELKGSKTSQLLNQFFYKVSDYESIYLHIVKF